MLKKRIQEIGWSSRGWDGLGEQRKRYFNRGSHYWAREKHNMREIPRISQKITPAMIPSNSEEHLNYSSPVINCIDDYPVIIELTFSNIWKQMQ